MVISAPSLEPMWMNLPHRQCCHELELIVLVDDLAISDARLSNFRRATACDANLQILMSTVLGGQPSTENEVPQEIKSYFSCREAIIAQNGLLFKGERTIVPIQLAKDMTEKILSCHLGIKGCLCCARDVFYQPRKNAQLNDFILKCDVCNSYKPQHPQEPLMSHEISNETLAKVWNRPDAILWTPVLDNRKLETTDSKTVFEKLKMQLSRHGIPEIMVSDNGPQYD